MESFVDLTLRNLKSWEKQTYLFLSERISAELMDILVYEYQRNPRDFFSKAEQEYKGQGATKSICQAVAGLSKLREILLQVPEFLPQTVPVEDAARIVFKVFQAGLFIGMACPGRGVEVLNWELERVEPLAKKGQRFVDGPKNERMDALSKAMWETLLDFENKNKRLPTAKQLWDTLPLGGYIQQKVEDYWEIHWKRPNGKEVSTSFKQFEARNTTLRKKFKKKHF